MFTIQGSIIGHTSDAQKLATLVYFRENYIGTIVYTTVIGDSEEIVFQLKETDYDRAVALVVDLKAHFTTALHTGWELRYQG